MIKQVMLNDGRKVDVSKFKVKQIRQIVKILSNLSLSEGDSVLDYTTIAKIIDDNFDDILTLISSCTSLTIEEIEDLDIDDMIKIIKDGIYEVNKDFLGKYLQPVETDEMESR